MRVHRVGPRASKQWYSPKGHAAGRRHVWPLYNKGSRQSLPFGQYSVRLPCGRGRCFPPNGPAKNRPRRMSLRLLRSFAGPWAKIPGMRSRRRKADLARGRQKRRRLTDGGPAGGGGRACGRLRIVRAFTNGAGCLPNSHIPVALAIDLDGPFARSPNCVAPRADGEFRFPIGAHHS